MNTETTPELPVTQTDERMTIATHAPEDLPVDVSDSGTETTVVPAVSENATAPIVKPTKAPWYQARINELTRERRLAEETRDREVSRLSAELEIARGTRLPDSNAQASNPADIDRLVQERATTIAHQQTFNNACDRLYEAGKSAFKGSDGQISFDAALAQLGQLGEMPPTLLEAVTELPDDIGPRVMYQLGTDLDLASELLRLSPTKLAVRLASLGNELNKPSIKPVSRTPAPITPISGVGVNDSLAGVSIDAFMARRNRDAPIRK